MFSRRTALACLFATTFVPAVFAQEPPPRPPFRIVGYLPNYRAAEFDPIAARELTDLVLFSAEPSASGAIVMDKVPKIPKEKISKLYENRDPAQRTRLVLCIGGWERSKNFAAVASELDRRRRFVLSTREACLANGFSGVDLDWEHPKTEAELEGYGDLAHELKTELQNDGIFVSMTIPAWLKLPAAAFEDADFVNIMAYDNPRQHATFESAKADVKKLVDQGVPPQKIVLGMPFYGRGVSKRDEVLTYAEIVEKYKPTPDVDEVGSLYFNGPKTIRAKTQFALEHNLGGVMFWELGQDAKGKDSLLRVIRDTVHVPGK